MHSAGVGFHSFKKHIFYDVSKSNQKILQKHLLVNHQTIWYVSLKCGKIISNIYCLLDYTALQILYFDLCHG